MVTWLSEKNTALCETILFEGDVFSAGS